MQHNTGVSQTWLCNVNWFGEDLQFYTVAKSKEIAFKNLCTKLAQRVGWQRWKVMLTLREKHYSWSIVVAPKKER